jgi:serine/threonine-protein kinase
VDVGEIVAAKYQIERSLGKGGMGYVVAARHLQLGHAVAIKLLAPELCQNEQAVARFLREARAAARIRSEHVARVLDVGTLDDHSPYIVMEFLEGRDLAKELEQQRNLSVDQAVDYILQSCEALADAHALGIVHRDLKPANLFRTERPGGAPLIKLLDFGIAKALVAEGQGEAVSLTSTQGVIGSPCYMSPEQVRRPAAVDTRSDIWSLGIILHEFLAGSPPFVADTAMSILAAVVTDEPPSLRDLRFDVPPELAAVVKKCLAKNPDDRYPDVVELAFDLKPFARETGDAAYARISAILRPHKTRRESAPAPIPWSSDAPTLESGGSKPGSLQSARPGDVAPPGTMATWGKSQGGGPTSRRRHVAWAAVAVVLLGLGALARYASRANPTIASIASQPGAPSFPESVPPIPQAAALVLPALTSQNLSSSTHEPDAAAAQAPPTASAPESAKSIAPTPLRSQRSIGASPAATKPSGSMVAKERPTKSDGKREAAPDDPLDGRH